jgi:CTP:molybdopterin cytidylyltransferase MocA
MGGAAEVAWVYRGVPANEDGVASDRVPGGDGTSGGVSDRLRPAVTGLLLAAGAGRRMGSPKALLRDPDGTAWVARVAQLLLEGGCAGVVVVVGAAADAVIPLVPASAQVVVATTWAEGMGASLRAGLAAVPTTSDAVVVSLVDTPGVTAQVVARLVALAGPAVLARAGYGGRPGHPVLIGRAHWPGVAAHSLGDAGARGYLAACDVRLVECGDLGHGEDVDAPAAGPPPVHPLAGPRCPPAPPD